MVGAKAINWISGIKDPPLFHHGAVDVSRAEWSADPTDTDLGHAYAFDLWWIKHLKADSIISFIPGVTIFHVAGNANSLNLLL